VAAAVVVRAAGFQTAYGGREIIRGNPDDPRVALTFDCGSVAGASLRILDTLKEHGLRVTFFMTGQYTDRYPDLVRRMVADGHEFANHSYGHPDFTKLTNQAILAELARTDELVRAHSGSSTKPWMRMPFGARDGRVMDVVSGAGYASVFWTLDSGDWLAEATVASVQSRVLGGIRNGAIVVHHCAAEQTAGALPAIFAGLTERGLQPVTLTELLR
jgi:peptidoglycan/xylan/chitin deacetylase (PgdA/CDA1 family)